MKHRPVVPRHAPRPNSEQVLTLLVRAKKGDFHARDEIIRANLGFIYTTARKIARQRGVEVEDLVQEGVIGANKAIDRFDPVFGVKFLSYAAYWIDQIINRAADKENASARSGTVHLVIKYNGVLQIYDKLVIGGTPAATALKHVVEHVNENKEDKYKITPEQLTRYFEVLRTLHPTSLDAQRWNDSEGTTLLDTTTDENARRLDDIVESKMITDRVRTIIALLRPKLKKNERLVLDLRLLPPQGREYTLQQVGDMAALTRERIRQIEKRVREKVKQAILTYELRSERERKKRQLKRG